ncbi:MAG: tetratricopeptide repeat protein [Desulfomonilaceae bacterium]
MDDIQFQQIPTTSENLKEKGIRLAREKEFPEAIEALKKFTEEDPTDSSAFNALAISYKNSGDYVHAMKSFEKALSLTVKPEERAKVLANIGNLNYLTGKYQAALGFYKDAAAADENNQMYLILIARTFVVLGEYDRARKVLSSINENSLKADDSTKGEDRGLNSYLLAEIYAGLNDEKEVYKNLAAALGSNPGRFAPKLRDDMRDEKSLFYTLQGDKHVGQILARYH